MTAFTRREALARGATLAATTLAGPLAMRAAVAAAATPVPAHWGVFCDGGPARARQLELKLGRRFTAYRVNSRIDKDAPSPALVAARDRGVVWTYQNCDLDNQHDAVTRTFADCAAGAYDARWREIARSIVADRRWTSVHPYRFSFNHEMSVSVKAGAGTAQEYVAAFRHVRAVFEAEGATVTRGGNVAFCYVPLLKRFVYGWPSADECDPGPEHYELVGCDIYNHRREAGLDFSPADVRDWLATMRDFSVARNRNWFFGEIGVADGPDGAAHRAKAAFINAVVNGVADLNAAQGRSRRGRCVAVCWTDATGKDDADATLAPQDYHLDSSLDALRAVRDAGRRYAFSAGR
jgi:hypothetical protein